jgi:hypothetical protein
MSACMMAKFGSGIALGGAAIASIDPSVATGYVNQNGVVGVLVIIALVLFAKSERQEKKADEYREARRLDEKARDEKLNGTLGELTNAIRAMHKHCEDRNR